MLVCEQKAINRAEGGERGNGGWRWRGKGWFKEVGKERKRERRGKGGAGKEGNGKPGKVEERAA